MSGSGRTEALRREPLLIPGLMQTEDYARAILRASRPRDTDAEIEQLVTARLARQVILTRDDPPDLYSKMRPASTRV